jgi:hypothetical protein
MNFTLRYAIKFTQGHLEVTKRRDWGAVCNALISLQYREISDKKKDVVCIGHC